MSAISPAHSPKKTRNAGETRERILRAARVSFSSASYDVIGIRDIAAAAGVDAALINRYFGNKAGLFGAVLEGGFSVEAHLSEHLHDLGQHLAAQMLTDITPDTDGDEDFDALRVLLRATGNPMTARMVSDRLHAEFILPLAALLSGPDAEVRAALITSYVIGIATLRHGLGSDLLRGDGTERAIAVAAAAIQACVEQNM